jgi:hypothetical protein
MKKSSNDREEKSAWSPISNSAVQVCIETSNFGNFFEFGLDRQSAATRLLWPATDDTSSSNKKKKKQRRTPSMNPAGTKTHHRRPDQSGQAVPDQASSTKSFLLPCTRPSSKKKEDREKFEELRLLAVKAIHEQSKKVARSTTSESHLCAKGKKKGHQATSK